MLFVLAPNEFFAQNETLPLKLVSPERKVEITIELDKEKAPVYAVKFQGSQVLETSSLGLELKRGGLLSKNMRVRDISRVTANETYTFVAGKTRNAHNHYNEVKIAFEETIAPHRQLTIIFRAYDDGAAFRYILPAQTDSTLIEVVREQSEFRFAGDLTCWSTNYGSFTTSQEAEFDKITASRIRPEAIIGLPLVCKTRDEAVTFALAEADLKDYAGMYFSGSSNGFGVVSRLAPRRDDASVAVRTSVKNQIMQTPWRVVMMGDNAGRLIESTLIMNLNPPSIMKDVSWIRPGKAAWDWWSGSLVEGVKATSEYAPTLRRFIDFAAQMKLEYMLVDAGWYTNLPAGQDDPNSSILRSIPQLDLPALVGYAREKDVGIWLWLHWKRADAEMDAAFPMFERLGIKGVKIDFMDSDDQEMVAFYHRVLSKAAAHRLMVNFHGAFKPTGLARTYPNYVTQEGVMGAEYNKWSARVTATHNVTLPFTRMLLGAMDYTPGGFRNTTPRDFKIRFIAPNVMTTRAHQLAMYVVYDSPVACVSDSPDVYANQTGAEFLQNVPTSWDETRVLAGDIGEYIIIARRRGQDWYLGAMTNEQAREVKVPLDFLGGENYQITRYADGAQPNDINKSSARLSDKTLTLKLASGGGCAARLTRMK